MVELSLVTKIGKEVVRSDLVWVLHEVAVEVRAVRNAGNVLNSQAWAKGRA